MIIEKQKLIATFAQEFKSCKTFKQVTEVLVTGPANQKAMNGAAIMQAIFSSKLLQEVIMFLLLCYSHRTYPGISFGSDLRDEAMVLETLTILNRKAEATQLVRTVATKLSQETWYSTQTTAYSLIAIAK